MKIFENVNNFFKLEFLNRKNFIELLKTHQRNCHVVTLFEGGKGKEM